MIQARRAAVLVAGALIVALLPFTAASAAPAAASQGDACGDVVQPLLGSWTCVFAEEFTGDTLDPALWTPLTTRASGFRNGPECYSDRRANVSVSDGRLRLTAHRLRRPMTCRTPTGSFRTRYTAASATSYSKFAQAFGRFEIRAKFPKAKVRGLHSALWLWPQDATRHGAWPASGEIDIAEFYTAHPDRAIPFLHHSGDAGDPNATNNYCLIDRPDRFHTYVLEWTPVSVTIEYDGQTCLTNLRLDLPFDHPFTINLTQGLGIFGNAFMPRRTPLPATTQVDYVRVWSWAPL